jgi:ribonuclease-3
MVETEQTELEAVLGHHFRQPEWLERALTHSSRLPEIETGMPEGRFARGREANERLEFLGDAILGVLVSEHLVKLFPDWSEGQLSKSRARLVNTASLCAVARRLGLGAYLRLGRGEVKTGGREKPAVLAGAYETVIAAVYCDAGLDAAREFVQRSLLAHALPAQAGQLGQSDDKSALQELLQGRGLPPAKYRIVSETGPDHRKAFTVEVSVAGEAVACGTGTSKKEAEQAAARLAREQLFGKDA